MTENENLPIGYADDAQIATWKNQYKQKNIHEIECEDEDGNKHAVYVKKPTLELLQMVANYDKQGDSIKGLNVMFNTLKIGGSDEVSNDEEMRMSAIKTLGGLFKVKEAQLKKR